MNIELLRQFLIKANKTGYASNKATQWVKEKDGSTTIVFQLGDFSMHDNFFGGEPYGGRQVVFYNGKPFWIMVYYGYVDKNINPKDMYPFLQKALSHIPEQYPYRGPKEFSEKEYIYKNTWKGKLDNFSGKEIITKNCKQIYQAEYIGGLVDH